MSDYVVTSEELARFESFCKTIAGKMADVLDDAYDMAVDENLNDGVAEVWLAVLSASVCYEETVNVVQEGQLRNLR